MITSTILNLLLQIALSLSVKSVAQDPTTEQKFRQDMIFYDKYYTVSCTEPVSNECTFGAWWFPYPELEIGD